LTALAAAVAKGIAENKIVHLLGLDWQIQTLTVGFALVVDWQIHDREKLEGLFFWKCLSCYIYMRTERSNATKNPEGKEMV